MTLLVVIVNYKTADLAVDCLRTLRPEVEGRPGVRVVVVDNASGDGSAGLLEAAVRENGWAGWAEVKPLDRNGGFAAGNNAAIAPALASDDPPRHVWMLNPDTLVQPGALGTAVDFLDAHPEVGLLGTRIENVDHSTQASWFTFPSVSNEFERTVCLRLVSRLLHGKNVSNDPPAEAGPVDWVSGASLFIRREVFGAVGLLDDGYFMYFEEVDFCLRAAKAGWPCWYLPESRVVHLIGRSSGVNSPGAPRKRLPGYWFEARRRYFLTHHGRLLTALADLAWTTGFLLNRVRRAVLRQPVGDPRLILWDFIRYNFLAVRP